MMSWLLRLLIDSLPLLLAAYVGGRAIRALVKGEVIGGGGRTARRMITRSANPVQFWVEMGLHFVVFTFFLIGGFLWWDILPL
jgi:hypothetical protein